MSYLRSSYTDGINFFGNLTPEEIAKKFGTPVYVYNETILRQRCRDLKNLSKHGGFGVNYSVKANSNPALLKIIREEGCSVDAMSPGELAMDKMAGYQSSQIIYISNNNDQAEMENAIAAGCLISVDSLSQLEMFGKLASGRKVMVRINPGIGEGHHAKVITGGSASKFGISINRLSDILSLIERHQLILAGFNQHIGSLFMKPQSYIAAAETLLQMVDTLPRTIFQGLEVIDFGGGFGIPYHKYEKEDRLDMDALANALHQLLSSWSSEQNYQGRFLVEPGRYIVAECGLLLGSATAIKDNGHIRFVGTDIGFNVLMRPMLYDSFHDIEIYSQQNHLARNLRQTIVGNICESGDILAKDRLLPEIHENDLIGVLDAGAYGFSMASNYNMRYLPAEVLITEKGDARLIRRRQTAADLEACLVNVS